MINTTRCSGLKENRVRLGVSYDVFVTFANEEKLQSNFWLASS